MSAVDYRSPAQRFATDLMHQLCVQHNTHGEVRRSRDIRRPDAHNIVTAIGGVQFTITVQEGRKR